MLSKRAVSLYFVEIIPLDINGDGKTDLILGGNEFGFQPQLGRLDASTGDVLLNDGKGNFLVQGIDQTGIEIKGQVRDMVTIKRKGQAGILFLINNDASCFCYLKKSLIIHKVIITELL